MPVITAVTGGPVTAPVTRWPHQVQGLAGLAAAFERSPRAQLWWACGAGKTRTARWYAEDIDAGQVVVFLPSLALVAQTLAVWQSTPGWPFEALVVCSDPSTGDRWRIDGTWWSEHRTRVTTDPAEVTRFLTGRGPGRRVVFCTYHSAPIVAAASSRRRPFDLMVADEAHRLAGDPDTRFRVVLDDASIPAARRLFATATPIVATGPRRLSMSDRALFGPVAHRYTIGAGIAAGHLVDYQVHVLGTPLTDTDGGRGQVVSAALAAAADGRRATRVISFHSRVTAARQFAAEVTGLRLPDGRVVAARAIAGADPGELRRDALAWLGAGHPGELRVLANARCLAEGVDVPAVDAVLFADPRTSDVDIVQAVGRVLRAGPGKTGGTVIVPVVLPAPGQDGEQDEQVEQEMYGGRYATVFGVLRALRGADPRLSAELDDLAARTRAPTGWDPDTDTARGTDSDTDPGGDPDPDRRRLRFDLAGVDLDQLVARVIDPDGSQASWDVMLGLLERWLTDRGHSHISWGQTWQGRPLGRWVAAQRRSYAAGALSPARVRRLATQPGWAWTGQGALWSADIAGLLHLAATGGGLDVNDPDVAARNLHGRGPGGRAPGGRLAGRVCAERRRDYRLGELSETWERAFEAIPGWTWDGGVDPRDQRCLDALAEWVDLEGDANVPAGVEFTGVPLGAFVAALRRRRVTGRLSPALVADVAVATAAAPVTGQLDWQDRDTRWQLALTALLQFATRTGGLAIPEHHVEELPDADIHLYAWARQQRHRRRHGNLDPTRERILGAVPGWAWELSGPARQISVDVGHRDHGTRSAYAAGCRCQPCTDANRHAETRRAELRAAGVATTDLVDAGPTRGHLRILEGQVGVRARPTMQRVTSLNKKTIDEIINGDRARIHPDTAAALLALTADQLLAHIAAHPSGRDQVPAGPTLALVERLVEQGWSRARIAREVSGDPGRKSVQFGRAGLVFRDTADAVAALAQSAGLTLTPPAPLAAVVRERYGPPVPGYRNDHTGPSAALMTATPAGRR